MVCSEECKERFARYEKGRDEWNKKYPNACSDCKGSGGSVTSYDPSPSGVSLSPGRMFDFDPCESCLCHPKVPKCPRCGLSFPLDQAEEIVENEIPCPNCGWNHRKDPDDYELEMPECLCFMDEDYDE